MRILIISSCTKSKKFDSTKSLKCEAQHMYTGVQHTQIKKAIKILQQFADVDFYIISAKYGVLHSSDKIASYELSFNNMTSSEIEEQSKKIQITDKVQNILQQDYDLIYMTLGNTYLKTINSWDSLVKDLTIAFTESKNENIISLEANQKMLSQLQSLKYTTHTVVGLKGDILYILAKNINDKSHFEKIIQKKHSLKTFINKIFNCKHTQNIGDYY